MFRTNFTRIFESLDEAKAGIARLESRLDALEKQSGMQEEMQRLREENRALGEQGLQVVEQLDQALRRIRELEQTQSHG